ncbi:hypothetical protein PAMP_006781 [Pampus punctatissimus]
MSLRSNQCLTKTKRKVNGHSSVEPQQLSKMHRCAAPYRKTDIRQQAASTPLPPTKCYYFAFFRAEEVPLPECSRPADLNETAKWPRAVTLQEAEGKSLPPPQTIEKKYPDLSNIRFPSLDDDDEIKHPKLLTHEVPLPSSPPPADASLHVYTSEKKHLGLTRFHFLDVDTEIVPKPLSKMAPVDLQPPNPPLTGAVLHMAHTLEKKDPDLRKTGFPSPDDELTCLMPKPVSIMARDVSLPPSPPLVESPHLEKKYLDLSIVTFPCLDND